MLRWLPRKINRAQVSAAMNKIVMNCYKYTHFQKYNNNNSKKVLVGKRAAFLPHIKSKAYYQKKPLHYVSKTHENLNSVSKELQFLMQLFAILIAVFLITNTFGSFFFGDRSDTSELRFKDAAMIPEILHLFSPNLAIKLTSFFRSISAENLSNNTRYMYIVCCSGWQNMPKTSQFFSL